MKTIHKFGFSITDELTIQMPEGAIVRSVGMQGVAPTRIEVWAEVETTARLVDRTVYVRGTGHRLPNDPEAVFVGTIICDPFVWHVFVA